MFGFFSPGYIKDARNLLKSAHKVLCYKKDIWSAAQVEEFEGQMKKLSQAITARDEKAAADISADLDSLAGQFSPLPADAGFRENCEVLLVAIIVALGVRTYFLQPFTIPTGSMQPTLNGIIGHPTAEPPPNIVTRVAQAVLLGRDYIDVVCKADGVVENDIVEFQRFRFFTYTQFHCGGQTYTVAASRDTLGRYWHVDAGMEYHKGEVIARGYVDTGDHVFVDKFTYNFRAPSGGNVFVFNTSGIAGIENSNEMRGINTSQFYIKRLAGTPGDELRVASPELFINGSIASAFGFQRVMAAKEGYRGYSQGPTGGYLTTPESKYRVPARNYFAMGDNSYNSSDSRYWGTVPQRNIVGRGLFVYWPFTSHWGSIK